MFEKHALGIVQCFIIFSLVTVVLSGCNPTSTPVPPPLPTDTPTLTPLPPTNTLLPPPTPAAPSPTDIPVPPDVTVTWTPNVSDVEIGQEIAFVVETDDQNVQLQWSAVNGTLSPSEGSAVIYTAPDTEGVDIVTLEANSDGGTTVEHLSFNVVAIPVDTPTPTPDFAGKVCQIKSGGDTNTIFLRQTEFDALGLPIGTKVTVTVRDTGESVGNVTLALDSNLEICSVRLAKPLREALGIDADTAIQSESQRPDRQFDITSTSPSTIKKPPDFYGKVCMIKSGQDTNTIFLRQAEYNAFGVPAGTTVSVTVLDTGRTVENVTLGLDSGLATCSVRLARSLREALGVAGDTDIDSPGNRPDRGFFIRLPQP